MIYSQEKIHFMYKLFYIYRIISGVHQQKDKQCKTQYNKTGRQIKIDHNKQYVTTKLYMDFHFSHK